MSDEVQSPTTIEAFKGALEREEAMQRKIDEQEDLNRTLTAQLLDLQEAQTSQLAKAEVALDVYCESTSLAAQDDDFSHVSRDDVNTAGLPALEVAMKELNESSAYYEEEMLLSSQAAADEKHAMSIAFKGLEDENAKLRDAVVFLEHKVEEECARASEAEISKEAALQELQEQARLAREAQTKTVVAYEEKAERLQDACMQLEEEGLTLSIKLLDSEKLIAAHESTIKDLSETIERIQTESSLQNDEKRAADTPSPDAAEKRELLEKVASLEDALSEARKQAANSSVSESEDLRVQNEQLVSHLTRMQDEGAKRDAELLRLRGEAGEKHMHTTALAAAEATIHELECQNQALNNQLFIFSSPVRQDRDGEEEPRTPIENVSLQQPAAEPYSDIRAQLDLLQLEPVKDDLSATENRLIDRQAERRARHLQAENEKLHARIKQLESDASYLKAASAQLAAAEDENVNLLQRLQAAGDESTNLKEEIASLATQLEDAQRDSDPKLATLQETIVCLKADLAVKSDELNTVAKQPGGFASESEAADLRAAVSNAEMQLEEAQAEAGRIQRQLREENEELQARLSRAEGLLREAGDGAAVQRKISQLEEENESLQASVRAGEEQRSSAELDERMRKFETEVAQADIRAMRDTLRKKDAVVADLEAQLGMGKNAIVSELHRLKSDSQAFKNRVNYLETEHKNAAVMLQAAEAQLAARDADSLQRSEEQAALQHGIKELETKLSGKTEQLIATIARFEETTQAMQAKISELEAADPDNNKGTFDDKHLRAEIDKLQSMLADNMRTSEGYQARVQAVQEKDSAALAAAELQVTELRTENEAMREQLRDLEGEKERSLDKQLEDLEATVVEKTEIASELQARMEQQNQYLLAQIRELTEDSEEMKARIAAVDADKLPLVEVSQTISDSPSEGATRVKELEEQLADKTNEVLCVANAAEETSVSLNEAINALEKEKSRLEQILEEKAGDITERAALEAENAELVRKLAEAEAGSEEAARSLKEQLSASSEREANLREQLSQLQDAVDAARQRLASVESEHEEASTQQAAKVAAFEAETAELARKLADAERRASEPVPSDGSEEVIRGLKEQLSASSEREETLREQLHELEDEVDVARQRELLNSQRLAAAESVHEETFRRKSELEQELGDIKQRETTGSEAVTELSRLKGDLERMQEVEQKAEAQALEMDRLAAENGGLRQEVAELQAQAQELEKKLQLEKPQEDSTGGYEALQQAHRELQDKDLQRMLSLEQDVIAAREAAAEGAQNVERLTADNTDLRNQINDLQTESRDLHQRVSQAEAANDTLTQQLQNVGSDAGRTSGGEYEALQREHRELQDKVATLEQDHSEANIQRQQALQQAAAGQQHAAEVALNVERLTAEVNDLEHQTSNLRLRLQETEAANDVLKLQVQNVEEFEARKKEHRELQDEVADIKKRYNDAAASLASVSEQLTATASREEALRVRVQELQSSSSAEHSKSAETAQAVAREKEEISRLFAAAGMEAEQREQALREQVRTLTAALQAAEQSREALEAAAVEASEAQSEHERRYSNLQTDNAKLAADLEQSRQQQMNRSSKSETSDADVTIANGRVRELETLCESLEKELRSLQTDNRALSSNLVAAKKELEVHASATDLSSSSKNSSSAEAVLHARISSMTQEIALLKAQNEVHVAEGDGLRNETRALRLERDGLKKTLAEQSSSTDREAKLKQNIGELGSVVSGLKSELDCIRGDTNLGGLSTLRNELATSHEELAKLRAQLNDAKASDGKTRPRHRDADEQDESDRGVRKELASCRRDMMKLAQTHRDLLAEFELVRAAKKQAEKKMVEYKERMQDQQTLYRVLKGLRPNAGDADETKVNTLANHLAQISAKNHMTENEVDNAVIVMLERRGQPGLASGTRRRADSKVDYTRAERKSAPKNDSFENAANTPRGAEDHLRLDPRSEARIERMVEMWSDQPLSSYGLQQRRN
eukprot:gene19736-30413_t